MKRILRRFEELETLAAEIAASMTTEQITVPSPVQVWDKPTQYVPATSRKIDWQKFTQWYSSVQALLSHVFTVEHPHYKNFERGYSEYRKNPHERFKFLQAVFRASKDDYEGGYMWDVRSLVHEKVLACELEQATELLRNGYKTPAAVVAGIVLETSLRERCEQNGIAPSSLNRMNDELAKAGAYNDARKTQVQAWAKLRNNAAHGKPDEFTESEVDNMISGVGEFVATVMV